MIEIGTPARQECDFGELMREHRSMVFSVVYHFLHDREQAEEIALPDVAEALRPLLQETQEHVRDFAIGPGPLERAQAPNRARSPSA